MLETAVSGLKSISRIFTKFTPKMYYGTEMNALNFGLKAYYSSRSRWNNICWNRHCTGGGIQYSTSRVELDFLVVFVRRLSGYGHVFCSRWK